MTGADNPCSQRHVKQFTECYRQISDRARWRLLDKDVALRPVGKGMQHQVHGFLERHQESGHCRVRDAQIRSEEHTSELQSLMRISYAVFCLKKKKNKTELK